MDRENNKVSFHRILERNAIQYETFKVKGTWESKRAAEGWLYERGYSFGSSDSGKLIAISADIDYQLPQKWKNFYDEEKAKVDGVIYSDDYREGEVSIYLFNYSQKHKSRIQDEKFAKGLEKCSKEFRKDILITRFRVKKTDIKKIAYTTIPDGTINSPDELKQAIINIYGNEN